MNIKYLLGAAITIPLLPLLYLQGKKIRRDIPQLPEADTPQGKAFFEGATQTFNLLAIGESTMAGVGAKTHKEGFVGTLAQELSKELQQSVDWEVVAKSGYTVQKVTQRLLPQLEGKKPDLIVVGLGGNNAFELNSPSKFRKDMEQLLQQIQQQFPTVPIGVLNMPPIKEFPAFTRLIKFSIGNLVELFGIEMQQIAQKMPNIHYNKERITLATWQTKWQVEGSPKDFFSDGVHPSLLTYQIWAKDFTNFIYPKL